MQLRKREEQETTLKTSTQRTEGNSKDNQTLQERTKRSRKDSPNVRRNKMKGQGFLQELPEDGRTVGRTGTPDAAGKKQKETLQEERPGYQRDADCSGGRGGKKMKERKTNRHKTEGNNKNRRKEKAEKDAKEGRKSKKEQEFLQLQEEPTRRTDQDRHPVGTGKRRKARVPAGRGLQQRPLVLLFAHAYLLLREQHLLLHLLQVRVRLASSLL